MMRNRYLYMGVFFILLLMVISSLPIDAQCAMCNATASTANEGKRESALALNRGILFLMSIPYILLSSLLLIWYSYSRQRRAEQEG